MGVACSALWIIVDCDTPQPQNCPVHAQCLGMCVTSQCSTRQRLSKSGAPLYQWSSPICSSSIAACTQSFHIAAENPIQEIATRGFGILHYNCADLDTRVARSEQFHAECACSGHNNAPRDVMLLLSKAACLAPTPMANGQLQTAHGVSIETIGSTNCDVACNATTKD